jgi:hypothetical protein
MPLIQEGSLRETLILGQIIWLGPGHCTIQTDQVLPGGSDNGGLFVRALFPMILSCAK